MFASHSSYAHFLTPLSRNSEDMLDFVELSQAQSSFLLFLLFLFIIHFGALPSRVNEGVITILNQKIRAIMSISPNGDGIDEFSDFHRILQKWY